MSALLTSHPAIYSEDEDDNGGMDDALVVDLTDDRPTTTTKARGHTKGVPSLPGIHSLLGLSDGPSSLLPDAPSVSRADASLF